MSAGEYVSEKSNQKGLEYGFSAFRQDGEDVPAEWDEGLPYDIISDDYPEEREESDWETGIISAYLEDIGQFSLLTAEEEIELAKKVERGLIAKRQLESVHDQRQRKRLQAKVREGIAARNHLVCANTRLVVSIARKFVGCGLPLSDLIQEGNCGLIRAASKFNYRMGCRFSTYATRWIRRAILRAISNTSRTIRIPAHAQSAYLKLMRAFHLLTQNLGRFPTNKELSRFSGIPVEQVERLISLSQAMLSLDLSAKDNEGALGDIVPDVSPSPAEEVRNAMLREIIERAIRELPEREAKVLRLHYGLDGEEYTLEEIGRMLGITKERVRQIEKQALRRLRHPLKARHLRELLSS